MKILPLLLYAVSAVAYAVHFARRDPAAGRAATAFLVLALLRDEALLQFRDHQLEMVRHLDLQPAAQFLDGSHTCFRVTFPPLAALSCQVPTLPVFVS